MRSGQTGEVRSVSREDLTWRPQCWAHGLSEYPGELQQTKPICGSEILLIPNLEQRKFFTPFLTKTLLQMISLFSAAVRAMYSGLLTSWKALVRLASKQTVTTREFIMSGKSWGLTLLIKITFIFIIWNMTLLRIMNYDKACNCLFYFKYHIHYSLSSLY